MLARNSFVAFILLITLLKVFLQHVLPVNCGLSFNVHFGIRDSSIKVNWFWLIGEVIHCFCLNLSFLFLQSTDRCQQKCKRQRQCHSSDLQWRLYFVRFSTIYYFWVTNAATDCGLHASCPLTGRHCLVCVVFSSKHTVFDRLLSGLVLHGQVATTGSVLIMEMFDSDGRGTFLHTFFQPD